MNYYKITFAIVVFGLLITSCSEDCYNEPTETGYLVFGHFYGECLGDGCVKIFKLESQKLLEDTKKEYPNPSEFYTGIYKDLDNTKFEMTKDLMDHFPAELLDAETVVFGCPDCADQGGLYIEYNFNEIRKYWIIDQSKQSVPDYLHDFMDQVNNKIELINVN